MGRALAGAILFVFRLGVLVVRLEGMPCAVIAVLHVHAGITCGKSAWVKFCQVSRVPEIAKPRPSYLNRCDGRGLTAFLLR